MATHDDVNHIPDDKDSIDSGNATAESLVAAVANASLQDAKPSTLPPDKMEDASQPPLKVYTRTQLLYLYDSPLVKPPEGMPSMKDWFGDWNEQQLSTKKDTEVSANPGNARERRFRRDPEDGDAPSRLTFRSTLSQPSQMGNFRHQSLRTAERDKERDPDKEKEREIRDKEGQERLRNLSDKYDRDRLALSSTSTTPRQKERDSAPHLAPGSSARVGQTQGPAATGRRADGRDPAKRKIGESSEDWRRGAEPTRTTKDDRSDNGRKDRENRERPRSRVRESSRSRPEPSTTRRDRDRDDKDRDRETRRDRRGDVDRDDPRTKDDYYRRDTSRDGRDRYDYVRQQRDLDRDLDDESRRWRDDGRRDERMAARRERGWDRFEERLTDDRDGRPKRGPGRERRGGEEGKDRDDKRERERDKEAQPAWMETYVPSTPGSGILGATSGDGELDGIQAWKKGMKERELKENGLDQPLEPSQNADDSDISGSQLPASSSATTSDAQLDEIQLFKLMMKREAEKKDSPPNGPGDFNAPASSTPRLGNSPSTVDIAMDMAAKEAQAIVNAQLAPEASTSLSAYAQSRDTQKYTQQNDHLASTNLNGSQPTLSVLHSSANEMAGQALATKPSASVFDSYPQKSRVVASRMGSANIASTPSTLQISDASSQDSSVAGSSPFNPPPGSRLLAFGARVPPNPSIPTETTSMTAHSSYDSGMSHYPPPGVSLPTSQRPINTISSKNDLTFMEGNSHPMPILRQSPHPSSPRGEWIQEYSYSPSGAGWSTDENDQRSALRTDALRRTPVSSAVERTQGARGNEMGHPDLNDRMGALRRTLKPPNERIPLGMSSEAGSSYNDLGGPLSAGGNYSPAGSIDLSGNITSVSPVTNKGSRFAKFFDAKSREQQNIGQKPQPSPGYVSTSPHPGGSRQDINALNGMMPVHGENRAMEDIFAMLQNSAQTHRVSPQIPHVNRLTSNGSPFGQNHSELQMLQQQQMHQPPPFVQHNRLDSLYDSRLDDRNFVPDGMVPGLRPAPRSRSRESSTVLYNDQIDDSLHYNVQRIAQQQQRNLEQMYAGNAPSNMYVQQAGMMRNGGIQLQQNQFRGASPISGQNPLQGTSQRLPPGLANLGGRPPHDPSQFINTPLGIPNNGIHGGVHGGSPAQQVYNNFNGGGLGFAGNPQVRGPPGVQNPLVMNSMAGLGAPNNMDLRAANQAQLLGMGGGLRGSGPGLGPQHGITPQMAASQQLAMRQQQQQHIPPHMVPHLLPHHLQQQQALSGASAQGTQDLMALLMGHRE